MCPSVHSRLTDKFLPYFLQAGKESNATDGRKEAGGGDTLGVAL